MAPYLGDVKQVNFWRKIFAGAFGHHSSECNVLVSGARTAGFGLKTVGFGQINTFSNELEPSLKIATCAPRVRSLVAPNERMKERVAITVSWLHLGRF